MEPIAAFGFIRRHAAEFRHAARVTIAVGATYALIKLLNMPQGYWAVITAVLVVQTSIGGSLKAALDRLLGTLAGALYGALVAIVIPHETDIGLGIALLAAIAPLSTLAVINPAFRVAPVTALIMLLPTYAHVASPAASALERILEIVLGNIVALAVSLTVLPARAHVLLREAAAAVVLRNAELMEALIEGLTAGTGRQGVQPIHARIRAAIKQAEAAADEAGRERRLRLAEGPDPEPLLRTLYRVRHDLVMIGRAAAKPLAEELMPRLGASLDELRDSTVTLLRSIAATFSSKAEAPSITPFQLAVRSFSSELDALSREGLAAQHSESERLFALQFALEQLAADLRDLTARASDNRRKERTGI